MTKRKSQVIPTPISSLGQKTKKDTPIVPPEIRRFIHAYAKQEFDRQIGSYPGEEDMYTGLFLLKRLFVFLKKHNVVAGTELVLWNVVRGLYVKLTTVRHDRLNLVLESDSGVIVEFRHEYLSDHYTPEALYSVVRHLVDKYYLKPDRTDVFLQEEKQFQKKIRDSGWDQTRLLHRSLKTDPIVKAFEQLATVV